MIAKTGILTEKGHAEVIDRELPNLKSTQVLIEVEKCNLCTTDYQQWQGLREHQGYPMAGGHENTGIVIEKGSNVLDIEIGDRIAIAHDFCGQCDKCRIGKTSECKYVNFSEKSADGYHGFFGLANLQIVDANVAVKINPDIPAEQAGFLEPLGTVAHGIKKLDITPFTKVAVTGAGTMGLLNGLCAQAYGAEVIFTEISEKKIKNAERLGFAVINSKETDPVEEIMKLTNNEGVDAVIGAVGSEKAYYQGLDMLKAMDGKFLVFSAGYPAPMLNLNANDIHYDKSQIIGTYGGDIVDFIEAGQLLSSGKIDVSGSLEGREYPLSQLQEAYEAAAEPDQFRVTVNCQEF